MTIKTFWTIFLKIMGIWLIIDSFKVLPQFIFSAWDIGYADHQANIISLSLGILVLTILTYGLVLWFFVLHPQWVIDKLHLNAGIADESLHLNMGQNQVIRIAVIVLGGLMFAESFPRLCMQVFSFIRHKSVFRENPEVDFLILYAMETVLAYLLMVHNETIAGFVQKKGEQKKENTGD